EIVTDSVGDGIRPVRVASSHPCGPGKPCAGLLLGLGEGQHADAVGVDAIIAHAEGLVTLQTLVVAPAGDPGAAPLPAPIADGGALHHDYPVRLTARWEFGAGTSGVQLGVAYQAGHRCPPCGGLYG